MIYIYGINWLKLSAKSEIKCYTRIGQWFLYLEDLFLYQIWNFWYSNHTFILYIQLYVHIFHVERNMWVQKMQKKNFCGLESVCVYLYIFFEFVDFKKNLTIIFHLLKLWQLFLPTSKIHKQFGPVGYISNSILLAKFITGQLRLGKLFESARIWVGRKTKFQAQLHQAQTSCNMSPTGNYDGGFTKEVFPLKNKIKLRSCLWWQIIVA